MDPKTNGLVFLCKKKYHYDFEKNELFYIGKRVCFNHLYPSHWRISGVIVLPEATTPNFCVWSIRFLKSSDKNPDKNPIFFEKEKTKCFVAYKAKKVIVVNFKAAELIFSSDNYFCYISNEASKNENKKVILFYKCRIIDTILVPSNANNLTVDFDSRNLTNFIRLFLSWAGVGEKKEKNYKFFYFYEGSLLFSKTKTLYDYPDIPDVEYKSILLKDNQIPLFIVDEYLIRLLLKFKHPLSIKKIFIKKPSFYHPNSHSKFINEFQKFVLFLIWASKQSESCFSKLSFDVLIYKIIPFISERCEFFRIEGQRVVNLFLLGCFFIPSTLNCVNTETSNKLYIVEPSSFVRKNEIDYIKTRLFKSFFSFLESPDKVQVYIGLKIFQKLYVEKFSFLNEKTSVDSDSKLISTEEELKIVVYKCCENLFNWKENYSFYDLKALKYCCKILVNFVTLIKEAELSELFHCLVNFIPSNIENCSIILINKILRLKTFPIEKETKFICEFIEDMLDIINSSEIKFISLCNYVYTINKIIQIESFKLNEETCVKILKIFKLNKNIIKMYDYKLLPNEKLSDKEIKICKRICVNVSKILSLIFEKHPSYLPLLKKHKMINFIFQLDLGYFKKLLGVVKFSNILIRNFDINIQMDIGSVIKFMNNVIFQNDTLFKMVDVCFIRFNTFQLLCEKLDKDNFLLHHKSLFPIIETFFDRFGVHEEIINLFECDVQNWGSFDNSNNYAKGSQINYYIINVFKSITKYFEMFKKNGILLSQENFDFLIDKFNSLENGEFFPDVVFIKRDIMYEILVLLRTIERVDKTYEDEAVKHFKKFQKMKNIISMLAQPMGNQQDVSVMKNANVPNLGSEIVKKDQGNIAINIITSNPFVVGDSTFYINLISKHSKKIDILRGIKFFLSSNDIYEKKEIRFEVFRKLNEVYQISFAEPTEKYVFEFLVWSLISNQISFFQFDFNQTSNEKYELLSLMDLNNFLVFLSNFQKDYERNFTKRMETRIISVLSTIIFECNITVYFIEKLLNLLIKKDVGILSFGGIISEKIILMILRRLNVMNVDSFTMNKRLSSIFVCIIDIIYKNFGVSLSLLLPIVQRNYKKIDDNLSCWSDNLSKSVYFLQILFQMSRIEMLSIINEEVFYKSFRIYFEDKIVEDFTVRLYDIFGNIYNNRSSFFLSVFVKLMIDYKKFYYLNWLSVVDIILDMIEGSLIYRNKRENNLALIKKLFSIFFGFNDNSLISKEESKKNNKRIKELTKEFLKEVKNEEEFKSLILFVYSESNGEFCSFIGENFLNILLEIVYEINSNQEFVKIIKESLSKLEKKTEVSILEFGFKDYSRVNPEERVSSSEQSLESGNVMTPPSFLSPAHMFNNDLDWIYDTPMISQSVSRKSRKKKKLRKRNKKFNSNFQPIQKDIELSNSETKMEITQKDDMEKDEEFSFEKEKDNFKFKEEFLNEEKESSQNISDIKLKLIQVDQKEVFDFVGSKENTKEEEKKKDFEIENDVFNFF